METPLKIVCNGQIIDVIMDNPVWVKQGNGFRLRCEVEEAQGIVSRDGSTTYQLENTSLMDGADQLLTVSAVTISIPEAEELLAQLEAGATPDDEDPEEPEQVVTLQMVYNRLGTVESDLADLSSAIQKGLNL